MNTYTFYSDPGHGWIAVPRAELVALGIDGQITSYSYQKGDMVYLEEDCDYATFANAKEQAGQPFNTREVYQENTPIRNYQSYTKK